MTWKSGGNAQIGLKMAALVGVVRQRCVMTSHGFVQSFDLTK